MPASSPPLSPKELSRYSRHILLQEIGVDGQKALSAARVLIVGAGGLGSPISLYLAAAGIGTVGIADLDRVAEHNLQRQLLYGTADVGEPKVSSAARRLRELNPHIRVVEHGDGIVAENAESIFKQYDVIVDGTDNFAARYLNNDAAFAARKPLVFGSVFKFEGQVAVFDPSRGGPCYRCLFPEPPTPGSVPGCGEAGVLGALCGVIGSLQALEAIKLILGMGEPLVGRLLTYDAMSQTFRTLALKRSPRCSLCGSESNRQLRPEPSQTPAVQPPPPSENEEFPGEISALEADELRQAAPGSTLILDVREPWEVEICQVAGSTFIPMRQISDRLGELPRNKHLLVICHHGSRSGAVTEYLRKNGLKAVTNIAGGIASWAQDVDPNLNRY